MNAEKALKEFDKLCKEGMTYENTAKALKLIGINDYETEDIKNIKLYSDYLPISDTYPYTEEQHNLHFLWEAIDLVPLGINCAFAIPYRQMIAKKLFKKCGDGFISAGNCKFNFGHLIEVGENVAWNANVYIDSKGGVEFGDYSMLAEEVQIFTHSHSETNHMERIYNKVTIGPYATIFVGATILPGVTVKKGAMVGGGSMVSHDVEENTLVAGSPAKYIRDRKLPEGGIENTNHYFFKDKMFQNK